MSKVLQPVKLIKKGDQTYISSFKCADESSWYPHKYIGFDKDCNNLDETFECIDKYILCDKSTVDFELEKYIIFNRWEPFLYILSNYNDRVQDYVHLIATCIVNTNSSEFIIKLMQCYTRRTLLLFPVKPGSNELCWLCFQTRNCYALTVLLMYGDWLKDDWLEELQQMDYMKMLMFVAPSLKDQEDINNPRNLIYAMMRNDVDLALQLVNYGIQVDVWNNFAMKIVITHEQFKSCKQLVKGILNAGGRIPHYMNVLYKQRQELEAQIEADKKQPLAIVQALTKHHHTTKPKEEVAQVKHEVKKAPPKSDWSGGWDDCIKPASFVLDSIPQ